MWYIVPSKKFNYEYKFTAFSEAKKNILELSFMQSKAWAIFLNKINKLAFLLVYEDAQNNKYAIPLQFIQTRFGNILWARHVFPYTFLHSIENFKDLANSIRKPSYVKLFKSYNVIGIRLHIRGVCRKNILLCSNGDNWFLFKYGDWHISPSHEMDFERTVILNLKDSYKPSSIVKRVVRKAVKLGVQVSIGKGTKDELELFYKFYRNTAENKGFAPWSFNYLYNQFNALSEEKQATIFWVYYKGRKIYGVIYYNDIYNKIAFYVHGAGIRSPFNNLPLGYVIHDYAIKYFRERNFEFVDLGGVGTLDIKHPLYKNSIIKRRFGGKETLFWHALELPLSNRWYLFGINTFLRNWYKGWYN